jgi:chaperonin GroEL
MRLDPTSGYDAKNKKIGNMYDLGIVDPHKVVRCALENAVSAASMLLSVDCCLINVKQNDNEDI